MKRCSILLLSTLTIASGTSQADSLGRFFFTPGERAQLDQARQNKQRMPQATTAEPVAAPAPPEVITYSGIVRRSDGKSILWLNNRPQEEREALLALPVSGRLGADGAVTLQVPQTGSTVQLKVGQRAELQSGRVAESRRTPPAPAPASSVKQPDNGEVTTKPEVSAALPSNPASPRNPERREQERARRSGAN